MSKIFYVNNLMQNADLTDLESVFTSVGDIESLQFEIDPLSKRGFGVVEMKTEKQAADCIECFNGKKSDNRLLSLSFLRPNFQTPRASRK